MGRSFGTGGAGGALQAITQSAKGAQIGKRTHVGINRFIIELDRRQVREEQGQEK